MVKIINHNHFANSFISVNFKSNINYFTLAKLTLMYASLLRSSGNLLTLIVYGQLQA